LQRQSFPQLAAVRLSPANCGQVLIQYPVNGSQVLLAVFVEFQGYAVKEIRACQSGRASVSRLIAAGIVWALVVNLIAWLRFGQLGISLILGAAMIISLLIAAISGLVIPLILHRLGIDPALSGSVVLTTVTDVVGFLSFLGLATLFLL
jgi:magnesium transporter